MGTRSEIIIKDYWTGETNGRNYKKEIKLYHHFDGYPSGVGRFLMENIYPMLVSSNDMDCNRIANALVKSKEDETYEITVYNHVDIEYRYIIDIPAKQIHCYEGHYSSWDSPNTRFIKTKEEDLNIFLPENMSKSYA